MKYIYKISLVLCLFVGITSCEDFITEEPTDTIAASIAFETIEDAQAGLFGAYAFNTGTRVIENTSWLTNNLRVGLGNNGKGVFMHAWGYNSADTNVEGLWNSRYAALIRVNDILANVDLVSGGTTEEVNQIKGEALALRAWAHFDLVRLFADTYGDGADNVGIPYQLPPVNVLAELPRLSVGEVYTNIIADLTEAKSLITENGSVSRVSDAACDAFLAQVYLTMENWQLASDHATAAIDASSALATGSSYTNMFRADADGEVIFKIEMTVNNTLIGQLWWDALAGINHFTVTDEVADLFEASDIRAETTYAMNAQAGERVVTKYTGTPGSTYGLNDLKILRTSDMYLIRSEAAWRLNGGGLADLNAVRTARSASTGTESGTDLRDAIWLERRKELMFEGSWWMDLKRTGQNCVRGADCNAGECTLTAGDYRWNLPIPQSEIFANSNMVQNNGY